MFADRALPGEDEVLSAAHRADGLTARLLPLSRPDGAPKSGWPCPLELLLDGMAFDLAPAEDVPSALALIPSPHLIGGEHQMPVLRRWLTAAMLLGEGLSGVAEYHWDASGRSLARAAYVAAIKAWQGGGAAPFGLLVAVGQLASGGIATRGLAFFTGQELELAPDCFALPDDGHRLVVRITAQLAVQAPLTGVEPVVGPDGMPLLLVPDGKIVRVRRG